MNGKKLLWVRACKLLALLLPAILLILLLPVNDYADTPRLQGFYMEEENSLDMVLIGSSENYAGYNPVLAYEEYGFTSYSYVLSATDFSLFEEQLDEVLRVQSPQLVVVDIGEMHRANRESKDTLLHQIVAAAPFSKHKAQMIREHGDSDQILSYWFPFCVNHGKMTPKTLYDYVRLNAAIQKRGFTLLKGNVTFTGTGENWDGPYVEPWYDTNGDLSVADLSQEVLDTCRDVVDVCRKHPDVQFLFINTPHRIANDEMYLTYQSINAMGEYLRAEGYDFINMESMTDVLGIVPETDFYNNAHLNLYGQYKLTRFLSQTLVEEYDLQSREQSPENQQRWDTCAAYQKRYYALFEEKVAQHVPGTFGLWLQEDTWLLDNLKE